MMSISRAIGGVKEVNAAAAIVFCFAYICLSTIGFAQEVLWAPKNQHATKVSKSEAATAFSTKGVSDASDAVYRPRSKYALMIGIGNYAMAPLTNTVNDVRAVASSLEEVGFDVDIVIDADKKTMLQSLGTLIDKSSSYDFVLLYYSGHGASSEGISYLVSVDGGFFSFEELSSSLSRASHSVYALFFDACRSSMQIDFGDSDVNLLSPSISAKQLNSSGLQGGGLLGYATALGGGATEGATNFSPYALALTHHITDEADLETIMRRVKSEVHARTQSTQSAWHQSSLSFKIFLR